MAAIARVAPEYWRGDITRLGDGTFWVRLFTGPGGAPIRVAVDQRFPAQRGRLLYARPSRNGALWPLLVEKAMAKLRGGYGSLPGHSPQQLAALTGWNTQSAHPASPEEAFEALHAGLARGWVAMTSSSRDARDERGLVAAHEYSVLKVVHSPTGYFVLLRNPWGTGVPEQVRDAGDGFFWVTREQYFHFFEGMTFSGPDV
jgi:hypothetical protein